MAEIDRVTVREELYSILQQKYVALLAQRGADIEMVIQSLLNQKAPPVGMKFISVPLPRGTTSEEGFEELFLSRLRRAIEHLPTETSLAQRVVRAIESCPASYTTTSRIREALDTLGRETTNYFVIILHALTKIPEKPLRNLLLMLREYSDQQGNHGEAGDKLRFLVVGDVSLWELCYHKTAERSPFNIAHRMLLDDLSYDELQRIGIQDSIGVSMRFRTLTGGVPIFVREATKKIKEDFSDLSLYFGHLQDDWNALDLSTQEILKRIVEGSLDFPECHHDYKCTQIPVIGAPWQDAFWKGFLRMRFCQLSWRSPIHYEFVKKCAGIEEASSNSMLIRLDLNESIKRLEKALKHEPYCRYKQEPLEEARILTLQTYNSELEIILDALLRDEKNETVVRRIQQLAASSEKDWLKELGNEVIKHQMSLNKFLIRAVLSRASLFLSGQFDVFLCYNLKDKEEVREIRRQLKDRQILSLPEEWELQPGQSWQLILELHISQVKSIVIFVGKHGLGLWQQEDLDIILHESMKTNRSVIPVILTSVPNELQFPSFLTTRPLVDFRKQDSDPLERLIQTIQKENT